MSDDTLTYEPNPEATDEPSGFGTFADDGTYTPRQITADDLGGSFEDAIDGTLVSVEDGQLVEGTVVKVDRDEVLLDIGYKSEGVIPSRELSIRNDIDPNEVVSVGEEVEALVLTKEDKDGRLVLSKKRAQYERAWGDIERVKEGLPIVKIRVGINSGPAVVGNVGTEKRVDYTVLGTSVNIASRLESGVAKPGQLVVSQNTLDRVVGSFNTESLGEFALKGLQQKMPVYAVKGSVNMRKTNASDTFHAATPT